MMMMRLCGSRCTKTSSTKLSQQKSLQNDAVKHTYSVKTNNPKFIQLKILALNIVKKIIGLFASNLL